MRVIASLVGGIAAANRRSFPTRQFAARSRDLAATVCRTHELPRPLDRRRTTTIHSGQPLLDWAIVEDQYGRDPALRYRQASVLLFPLTTISKRVEADRPVQVRERFDAACATVGRLRAELAVD
jgi:hypothetical protein